MEMQINNLSILSFGLMVRQYWVDQVVSQADLSIRLSAQILFFKLSSQMNNNSE